jgi:hemerythrin
MAFLPWTDALQLGIASIDLQHRWLVDTTNALHEEMSTAAPDRAVIGRIIEGLVDYTMNHFIHEEELFLRFGYPETPGHKAEHDSFAKQAMELLTQFEEGQSVGGETLEFLKSWLLHHNLKVDRAYAPFLLAQGVR